MGLMILEVACNVFLPQNGPFWQALREADFDGIPYLTAGKAGNIPRDANGLPVEHDSGISQVDDDDNDGSFSFGSPTHNAKNLFGSKRTELQQPPKFMLEPNHPNSLDNLIYWILQPDPAKRPTAEQVLAFESVVWISSRRAAGATVFEGNWGPQVEDEKEPAKEAEEDTEMTDA